MNISSISSGLNSSYSDMNNKDVIQLQKQKAVLEKEIQKVQQSNDAEKTKQQKIKELQLKLQQIEAQIQQETQKKVSTQLKTSEEENTMSGIQGISNTNFLMNMQSTNNKKGQDPFLTDAAKTLGISFDDLKSQLDSGTDLNSIVTSQGMTVDDFQQKMAELNPNKGQVGGFQNAPPPGGKGKGSDQFITDAASILGISADDIKTKLQSGTDLQTLIKEQGLTMEDFQQQMITLFNSHQSANANQTGAYVDSTT